MSGARLLIADDNRAFCDLFQDAVLQAEPSWVVEAAGDGREALKMLCEGRFEVAVLDVRMPHLDGLEVLRAARSKHISTDIILLTGYATIGLAVQGMKDGAQDFLRKPILLLDLIALIRNRLEFHHQPLHVRAERLDDYLKAHAHDPALTLSDLCRRFNIVRSYASRFFREHLHASFAARRAYHRVEMAKPLLKSTHVPLKSIAHQSGFRDQRRFSETFRRLVGMPPNQYRKDL